MLCRITYPDTTTTDLYYAVDGAEVTLRRIVNPGNATIKYPTVDLGYTMNFPYAAAGFTVPILTKVRDVLASDMVAYGLISDIDDYRTVATLDSNGRVTSVQLPKANAGDTSRQRVWIDYQDPTNETRTRIDGLDNAGSSADWDRLVQFDDIARVTLDQRALNATSTTFTATSTTWDPGADRALMAISDGQVSSTVYDASGKPTDSYGPANLSCFNLTTRLPNGTCTNPPVPHTSTEYDTTLNTNGTSSPMTGLSVTVFPDVAFRGKPSNVTSSLSPNTGVLNYSWPSGAAPEVVDLNGNQQFSWYALRMTGQIVFPAAGTWTFTSSVDDWARVWIDDQLVLNAYQSTGSLAILGPVAPDGSVTKRIRIDFAQGAGPAALRLQWAGPGVATQDVPLSALRPNYGLPTRTTVDDNSFATPTMVTHTEYTAAGLDAAWGLPTREVVDPTGLKLTTTTGYETTGFRRRVSRTLPAGNTTTYEYYGATEGAPTDVPCTADNDTTIAQGARLKKSTQPTAADNKAIISRVIYDRWGRAVAAQSGTRTGTTDTWDPGWACTTYDVAGERSPPRSLPAGPPPDERSRTPTPSRTTRSSTAPATPLVTSPPSATCSAAP